MDFERPHVAWIRRDSDRGHWEPMPGLHDGPADAEHWIDEYCSCHAGTEGVALPQGAKPRPPRASA